MSSLEEQIKGFPAFRELPEEAIASFSKLCVQRIFNKGEIIYTPGGEKDRMFFVIDGEVTLYQSSEGRKVVIQALKAGEFFGDLSFAHDYPFRGESYARTDQTSSVCVMAKQDMESLLERHPKLAMVMLVTLRNRLHQAESKIKDLAISSAETRLINELIRYAVTNGKEDNGFYEIRERLTHQRLSEMIGVTRETVTKTLNMLRDFGFIQFTKDRLIRLNKEKITKECVACLKVEEG